MDVRLQFFPVFLNHLLLFSKPFGKSLVNIPLSGGRRNISNIVYIVICLDQLHLHQIWTLPKSEEPRLGLAYRIRIRLRKYSNNSMG